MSGDNFSDGSCRTRPVLGDITNRSVKRRFFSVSGDLGLKSRDGYHENAENEHGELQIAKQVWLGVENLIREKRTHQPRVDCSSEKQSSDSSPTKMGLTDASAKNIASIDGGKSDENMKTTSLLDGNTIGHGVAEEEDASREDCFFSGLPDKCSQTCQKNGDKEPILVSSTKESSICTSEALDGIVFENDGKDLGVGRLASDKGGSSELSKLHKTPSYRSLELDRCVGIKNDGCTNLNLDVKLFKACSCSFCLKAAYIWSDLHYKDIMGRLDVLEKSQKEAGILAQKSGREKQTDVHGLGYNSQSSKLESDLMSQWRLFFLKMEDIFVRESNQLKASCITLNDLREELLDGSQEGCKD
ncbi:hypothetical protein SLEP1_g34803 [Rubroshorea leprosula]|uniref:Uncharacterized protein n=1 Tax=Rubroshorea leprosula TaxID=152421 RepID=A0AAV5KL72_9ROSI|nr:hypothetical protein SLEP1_g34803 [Rubroshorea leprosula]